ncbi:hypothetical protein L7F22_010191 [Adiantum nelumboides]|nr:hypothetical protein [Adiantum nelumboides]
MFAIEALLESMRVPVQDIEDLVEQSKDCMERLVWLQDQSSWYLPFTFLLRPDWPHPPTINSDVEHTVNFVLRLLSPPASNDRKLSGHHLVQHASMLYATLGAIHVTDALHVLSLYGKTCELAAALLPICEVFGSLTPTVPLVTGSKEEVSVLTVFSLAFLILIKICKFHRAPLEHWTTGSGLNLFNNTSLEYLLVRHNMQVVSSLGISSDNKGTEEIEGSKLLLSPSGFGKTSAQSTPPHYVLIDSFPRLRAWFLQQKSCVTTGSIPGVASADSVHQVGDRLLAMMLKKANKSGNLPTTPSASGTSTVSDDPGGKPLLPAWDLLAAIPFVVDALLTACGHGKLQPRDLTTGIMSFLALLE